MTTVQRIDKKVFAEFISLELFHIRNTTSSAMILFFLSSLLWLSLDCCQSHEVKPL